MVAKDPVDKLTHALCGLGRPFETLNSKRKLFYYHSVTPQYRTRGVNLLYAQRTAMPHSPTSDRCDQLIFRGNIRKIHDIDSCYFPKKEERKKNRKKERKRKKRCFISPRSGRCQGFARKNTLLGGAQRQTKRKIFSKQTRRA